MIPRTLHQCWIGPNPIPDREKRWCDAMQRMNPSWRHTLHGNEALEKYSKDPYIAALLRAGSEWAYVSDRLRCLILRDNGGVYLDTDCEPHKPLDNLLVWDLPSITFVCGMRSPHRKDVALHRAVSLIDNTFLASAQGGRIISRLCSLWAPGRIVINGHAIGLDIMENTGHDTLIINHRYFYAEQKYPETICLHDGHNLASWLPKRTAHAQA
jgi:hypothetical protein